MRWILILALVLQVPRFRSQHFACDLPVGWRLMTPDEAVVLRSQLPFDMQRVDPGRQFVIGAVDRWLAGGFDGRALVARVDDGVMATTQESVDKISAHWRDWRDPAADDERRRVVASRITELGQDRHAAIELRLVIENSRAGRDLGALEFYLSTAKRVLILSLRAWDDTFSAAEPELRALADSLTFARPARAPEELSDRLLYAAVVGGLVGLLLLGLSRSRRRR